MKYIQETIGKVIDDIARKHPKREALVHTGSNVRFTYSLLTREINRVARGFLACGIAPADKVAIWCPNIPEWLVAVLGLAKIGAVTVPVDPAASRDNLLYILEQSECCGLIVSVGGDNNKMAGTAEEALSELSALRHIFLIGDSIPWRVA